jgi:hypothetical protein
MSGKRPLTFRNIFFPRSMLQVTAGGMCLPHLIFPYGR